jgi:hypothetical protein
MATRSLYFSREGYTPYNETPYGRTEMLARKLAIVNLFLTTTITTITVARFIKHEIDYIAETEQVCSARQYVLVRLARGDYNNLRGIETMRYDYKFYNIISHFHE